MFDIVVMLMVLLSAMIVLSFDLFDCYGSYGIYDGSLSL